MRLMKKLATEFIESIGLPAAALSSKPDMKVSATAVYWTGEKMRVTLI